VTATQVTVQGIDIANCGTGIELGAPGGDRVQDDNIGVDLDGQTAAPCLTGVEIAGGSSGDLIGGTTADLRNVISGDGDGVRINGPSNTVQGNFLGTDETGTGFVPDQLGVLINAASGNIVGGSSNTAGQPPGNVIVAGSPSSAFNYGVLVIGSSNHVQGNLIGTDVTGEHAYVPSGTAKAAAAGVLVAGPATSNVIGGQGKEGNLIAGASHAQVEIDGAGAVNTEVLGNTVGATTTGESIESAAAVGILAEGAAGTTIGNKVSGNTVTGQQDGMVINADSEEIDFSVTETHDGVPDTQYYAVPGTDTSAKKSETVVAGNVIGPLPDGRSGPTQAQTAGILDQGGIDDVIGPANQVSWNGVGIDLSKSEKTVLGGNNIGLQAAGTAALPNAVGVLLDKTTKTQLGTVGHHDTISGNRTGVLIGGDEVTLNDELIGTTTIGNAAPKRFTGTLPTVIKAAEQTATAAGIDIEPSASKVVIGGDDATDANVISGNEGAGILAKQRFFAAYDKIGVGENGHSAVGNTGNGIEVTVGSKIPIQHDEIAHNDKAGVRVEAGDDVRIHTTTIYDNHDGGIIYKYKTSPPDRPKLTSARNEEDGLKIVFDLKVPGHGNGDLAVFATPSCEAHGAGKKLLDTVDVDPGTHHDLHHDFDHEPVGTAITATLTTQERGTSEFSTCEEVKPSKKH
jgi:hypothetical protein